MPLLGDGRLEFVGCVPLHASSPTHSRIKGLDTQVPFLKSQGLANNSRTKLGHDAGDWAVTGGSEAGHDSGIPSQGGTPYPCR
ncbi:unnamed protein product [Fusarium graminearum]|uniref:Chromosome 4, complete genome n=2 Tax=Gibberella zeae TaxID=5518 RepID=A0A0E0SDV2_GIBZE|nr:hypothetical protein FG05_30281 [Fusarium graminearum]CAF3474065.1 unnamed protein product [Fusarium graminearum]CAF3509384.1 unnamed protein product [Fusarium graminearum]CAG1996411.1 unnamed protein product [Fusarium graminearum]CAG2011321.1 unnamed protein product [Fusarium graminearum]